MGPLCVFRTKDKAEKILLSFSSSYLISTFFSIFSLFQLIFFLRCNHHRRRQHHHHRHHRNQLFPLTMHFTSWSDPPHECVVFEYEEWERYGKSKIDAAEDDNNRYTTDTGALVIPKCKSLWWQFPYFDYLWTQCHSLRSEKTIRFGTSWNIVIELRSNSEEESLIVTRDTPTVYRSFRCHTLRVWMMHHSRLHTLKWNARVARINRNLSAKVHVIFLIKNLRQCRCALRIRFHSLLIFLSATSSQFFCSLNFVHHPSTHYYCNYTCLCVPFSLFSSLN